MDINRAIVCLAVGPDYIKRALRLAESAKRTNPQYPFILYTIGDVESANIDKVYQLPPLQFEHFFLDRVNYYNSIIKELSFDQLLFLDSDTFICDDLSDAFRLLDRCDLLATHAISRATKQLDSIPMSFPELHCGVLAVNKWRVIELFARWFEIYKEKPEFFGNDQPPFRQAVWERQNIKLGILPPEYCFRYRWGGFVGSTVKILHGKENNTPYEKIEGEVNKNPGDIRVFTRRELA